MENTMQVETYTGSLTDLLVEHNITPHNALEELKNKDYLTEFEVERILQADFDSNNKE